MSNREIKTIDVRLSDGEVLRYNGCETQLSNAIDLLEEKALELRLSKTNRGRLKRYFLQSGFSEGSAEKFSRELDKRGFTDQPLTPPEPPQLDDEEVEAIRVLHDAAEMALRDLPMHFPRIRATELAIEKLKRFMP
jgi:hypothetical protein